MAGKGKEAAVSRVAGKRYWRAAEARIVVEAWRASGEGLGAFAKRYGINRGRLGRWVGRLGREAEESVVFHPVRLVTGARAARPCEPIEIVLGEVLRVRVPGGFGAEDLERVLGVLGRATSC